VEEGEGEEGRKTVGHSHDPRCSMASVSIMMMMMMMMMSE